MSSPDQPNILWLCTDQQRFDTIRALGNSRIITPNLDHLVADGTTFTNAFCQSPVCSPSRASFLTGRYPRTTRCRQNGQQIPPDEILLPKMFADAGYRCGLAGKLHLSSCSDGKVEQRIDDQVGRILTALEDSGQRENTIVIFMSDHGEMLGDHGLYFKGPHFYDEAIRVPLIMRWPNKFQANQQADGLVELIDLAPTLLEAAGIQAPADRLQGRSLMPMLTGSGNCSTPEREFVFCEYYNSWTHPDAYATMIRSKVEKIVVYHGSDQGELYDLKNDPDEFHNLWSDPSHTERKLRLLKRCFDASVFSMDPGPTRLGPF
ncbi:MAG: sulfatase-like hydrolase/transferase [Verrucomicrobia bacterium]|nr:sulfatase-like hydrolase/transferase [Verrucomicrobiota bacterium]